MQRNLYLLSEDWIFDSIEKGTLAKVELYRIPKFCFKDENFVLFLEPNEEQEAKKLILENGGSISNYSLDGIQVITSESFVKKAHEELYNNFIRNRDPLRPLNFKNIDYLKARVRGEISLESNVPEKYRIPESVIQSVDWYKLEKFSLLENRMQSRKIDRSLLDIIDTGFPSNGNNLFVHIPNDVAFLILGYLEPKELIKMRLVSKLGNVLSMRSSLWKTVCENVVRDNSWIPSVDLEKVNITKMHWYRFYREKLYPLLLDKQKIEQDWFELTSVPLSEERLKTRLHLEMVISTKQVKNGSLKLGATKIGGW